jgi:hypothetical protein
MAITGESRGQRPPCPHRLDPQVHQVGGAGQLQQREGDRRSFDDGTDPDGHGHDHHVGPEGVPDHRGQHGAPTLGQGPADHEQHARAGTTISTNDIAANATTRSADTMALIVPRGLIALIRISCR